VQAAAAIDGSAALFEDEAQEIGRVAPSRHEPPNLPVQSGEPPPSPLGQQEEVSIRHLAVPGQGHVVRKGCERDVVRPELVVRQGDDAA